MVIKDERFCWHYFSATKSVCPYLATMLLRKAPYNFYIWLLLSTIMLAVAWTPDPPVVAMERIWKKRRHWLIRVSLIASSHRAHAHYYLIWIISTLLSLLHKTARVKVSNISTCTCRHISGRKISFCFLVFILLCFSVQKSLEIRSQWMTKPVLVKLKSHRSSANT